MGIKKKNFHRKPPLSLLDQCIYYLALVLSFAGTLLLYFRIENIQRLIAFLDSTVIANSAHASFLFVLPLMLYFEISTITFFAVQLSNKVPIFGNPKITYGQDPWDKNCYPLFDKRRKNTQVKASDRKLRKKLRTAWIVGLLIVLAIAPLGLFGRTCLHDDYSIHRRNALNLRSEKEYTQEDYRHLTLKTSHITGYRIASRWEYSMEIEMNDGKSFVFDNRDFFNGKTYYNDVPLQAMTNIKQLFSPAEITIVGAEDVDTVADFYGMNESQRLELQKLFMQ